MATLEQLTNALRKADAAGATDDARRFAQAIRDLQSQSAPAPQPAQPVQSPVGTVLPPPADQTLPPPPAAPVPAPTSVGGSQVPPPPPPPGAISAPELPTPAESAPPQAPAPQGPGLSPEKDAEARRGAKALADMLEPGSGTLMRDQMTFGVMQKLSGLVGQMSKGEPQEYGEALYRYYLEEAEKRSSAPGLAKVAGAIIAPGPKGMGSAAGQVGMNVGEAMVGSAVDTASRQLPSEANAADVVNSAAGSGLISGALSGVGRLFGWGASDATPQLTQKGLKGKQIQEVAQIAKSDLGVPQNRAATGSEFIGSVRDSVSELNQSGKDKIIKATDSGLELSQRPAARLQYAVRRDYDALRRDQGLQAIPITETGTPGAFAVREAVDAIANADPDKLTIKNIDQLRTQIRGARSRAANKTDLAAIDDLESTLDNFVEGSLARGEFQGDKAAWSLYKKGREEISKVFNLESNKTLDAVLKDETVPGTAIADLFFRLDTPAKTRRASKLVSDLATNLGNDAEAMAPLRAGFLQSMLSEENPARLYKNLNMVLDDPELVQKLFTPEQFDKLGEIKLAMEKINVDNITPQQTRDIVGPAIEYMANSLGGTLGRLAKASAPAASMSIATGAVTGSPAAALAAGGATLALQGLAKKPVRRAVEAAANLAAPGVGRLSQQNGPMMDFVPEEEQIRDYMSRVLEGAPQ